MVDLNAHKAGNGGYRAKEHLEPVVLSSTRKYGGNVRTCKFFTSTAAVCAGAK
jgi:hypothetical protein